MSFKDLAALSNWLGSKQYFLGSKATTVDCMLFGHLAQFLFIDIGFPQKVKIRVKTSISIQLKSTLIAIEFGKIITTTPPTHPRQELYPK